MDEMTCPKCAGTMHIHQIGAVPVARCSSCAGIFLERADLGTLGEAENDWHADRGGPKTEPLPRIHKDMVAPPPVKPAARSFLETLFG
jgi:Zn-finger nucleic acid-binding protein